MQKERTKPVRCFCNALVKPEHMKNHVQSPRHRMAIASKTGKQQTQQAMPGLSRRERRAHLQRRGAPIEQIAHADNPKPPRKRAPAKPATA